MQKCCEPALWKSSSFNVFQVGHPKIETPQMTSHFLKMYALMNGTGSPGLESKNKGSNGGSDADLLSEHGYIT